MKTYSVHFAPGAHNTSQVLSQSTTPASVTIHSTGQHRTVPGPYRAGNYWLFHFHDCYE